MKFNKLRLLGFKSFVEPTDFVIEGGLTGIVGPNGCGKSNLVEAMRWIMGENSYKNMRASTMDDVIFSGSGQRPARNTAEVGLYLDNSDRTAPAAFNDSDEIQVTRRIERESGSAYRINGKDARAKDVQLLFADASTGARSPSMVGQGRIGELIQSKPQARRQLLEEAAGISGLYSRRHEAELRLRATEANLERLDDVTAQMDQQIESLKRQTRQANRFKSLSANIRQIEATLLHIRWQEAVKHNANTEAELTQTTNIVAQNAAIQAKAARDQAVEAHKLPEFRDNEARAAAALQRLQIGKSQLEEEASRLNLRKTELEQRLSQLQSDIKREENMIQDNAAILQRLDNEEQELKQTLAGSDEQARVLKTEFEAASSQLVEIETELSAMTSQRAEAAAGIQQLERRHKELNDRKIRMSDQKQRQTNELRELEDKISRLVDTNVKQAELTNAEDELSKAQDTVTHLDDEVENARKAEKDLRGPVSLARAKLNEIETEAKTISKILNASTDIGAFTPIVDNMKVKTGFETALGAALGDDLELPLDQSAPAYWNDLSSIEMTQSLPEGIAALGDYVNAPEALTRRLSQIGLVDTIEQGVNLQSALRPGQRLVSRDGAMWRWDGYCASADAPTAAAMRLAQKNRLLELDQDLLKAQSALKGAEQNLKTAEDDIVKAQTQRNAARQNIQNINAKVIEARKALAQAQDAASAFKNRQEVLNQALQQYEDQLNEIDIHLKQSNEDLSNAPDITALDKQLEDIRGKTAAQRGVAAQARAQHEGMERENQSHIKRLSVIADDRATWHKRGENAQTQIQSLHERLTTTQDELTMLNDAPDDIVQRRVQLMKQLEDAEILRKKAADQLAEAETRSRDADRVATEAIASLSSARENRGRAEERLAAAKERLADTKTRIIEALNCEPHEAIKASSLGPDDDIETLDVSKIEKSLERLKLDRERLGAVNLRAEEEQRELSEKHEELMSDRDDVIEAIGKLRTGIQSLNKEGRERLLSAFHVVDEQFKRLFTHLFGGGTAELQLVESDDPLEAGLEILARPPGKKPQTMTLLSGGEQALTAMALIFAVFLTNPAPICVLDEVDAPLDDHNVERFCNLMDEMSASTETRFVIITHNPITMARMDRLFGVTMAEQGVSQLVSVDLQAAEKMRDVS